MSNDNLQDYELADQLREARKEIGQAALSAEENKTKHDEIVSELEYQLTQTREEMRSAIAIYENTIRDKDEWIGQLLNRHKMFKENGAYFAFWSGALWRPRFG
jgi:hypothetical protein